MEASKQEKTENELIAEFMGGVYRDIGGDNKWYYNIPIPKNRVIISETCSKYVDELEYHKSWDWLMPVVEKIHDIRVQYPDRDVWADVITLPIYSPIDDVYEAVVNFVKWYNSQKPLPL